MYNHKKRDKPSYTRSGAFMAPIRFIYDKVGRPCPTPDVNINVHTPKSVSSVGNQTKNAGLNFNLAQFILIIT